MYIFVFKRIVHNFGLKLKNVHKEFKSFKKMTYKISKTYFKINVK